MHVNGFNLSTMSNLTNTVRRSSERISSGLRINRAADDASGLSMAERMKMKIRTQEQVSRNMSDGINLLQVAESGLDTGIDILQRVRELGVQASSETLSDSDFRNVQVEVHELLSELDKISVNTRFNEESLLIGETGISIMEASGETFYFEIKSMQAVDVGLYDFFTGEAKEVSNRDNAVELVNAVDTALKNVIENRSQVGITQKALEYKIKTLSVMTENETNSLSRVLDTDVARELMNMTKANMLLDVNRYMSAQSKTQYEQVLSLLK